METIVVGVDGAPSADEALRFAVREAKLRGARLRLVSVWHIPTVAYGGMGVTMLDSDTEYEEEANQVLGAAIGRFADELAGIEVQRVVREGRAASGLVDESREAALLVVGSRGHGGVCWPVDRLGLERMRPPFGLSRCHRSSQRVEAGLTRAPTEAGRSPASSGARLGALALAVVDRWCLDRWRDAVGMSRPLLPRRWSEPRPPLTWSAPPPAKMRSRPARTGRASSRMDS